jgi:hypothetical protein
MPGKGMTPDADLGRSTGGEALDLDGLSLTKPRPAQTSTSSTGETLNRGPEALDWRGRGRPDARRRPWGLIHPRLSGSN